MGSTEEEDRMRLLIGVRNAIIPSLLLWWLIIWTARRIWG